MASSLCGRDVSCLRGGDLRAPTTAEYSASGYSERSHDQWIRAGPKGQGLELCPPVSSWASLATTPVPAPIPGGGSEEKEPPRIQGQFAAQSLFTGTTWVGGTTFYLPGLLGRRCSRPPLVIPVTERVLSAMC